MGDLGVFADITKLRILNEITLDLEWALNPMIWGPWKGMERQTREKACEDGGGDQSDVATSQGMPGATRSWKGQEGGSPRPFRSMGPADTLILQFWPPEL